MFVFPERLRVSGPSLCSFTRRHFIDCERVGCVSLPTTNPRDQRLLLLLKVTNGTLASGLICQLRCWPLACPSVVRTFSLPLLLPGVSLPQPVASPFPLVVLPVPC